MSRRKKTKPTLEMSIAPGQVGDEVAVQYCVYAPSDSPIYVYDGPGREIVYWRTEPDVCTPIEDRFPLLYYYKAHLEIPIGISVAGFEVPATRCLDPGSKWKGSFSLRDRVVDVGTIGPSGEPIEIVTPLPARFQLQMVLGFNEKPLKVPTSEMNPEAVVLKWQKALESNVLTVRRSYCWSLAD